MKPGKIIFWTLLAGVAITGGILIYKKFSVKDAKAAADDLNKAAAANPGNPAIAEEARQANITAQASQTAPAGFPLRRGSNNALVKRMQEELMKTYGRAATLPKYGADGIFGAETESALTSKGFPTTVTEAVYNLIIQGRSVNGTAIRTQAGTGVPLMQPLGTGAYQVGSEGATIKLY